MTKIPKTVTKIPKTVKQYSEPLNTEDFKELETLASRYTSVKNYVTSRYSGINSLHLLYDYKRLIRNEWVTSKFYEQFHLPARYWKLALDEGIANIKSEWSNTKNRIKKAAFKNENLTEDEKHYIFFILKWNNILQKVLQHKDFEKPEKLNAIPVKNEKRIHNLICRYVRKYKGKIPYFKKERSFMVDAQLYKYETVKENFKHYVKIKIASLKKYKRITVSLKDHNIHSGNLRIVSNKNYHTLEVHKMKEVKADSHSDYVNTIGIDKGYTSLFAVSSDKEYGTELGLMLRTESDRLSKVNQKRNQIRAQVKKLKEEGNLKKALNIERNNLRNKKYIKKKQKAKACIESYINHEIKVMLQEEKHSVIACEKLDFESWNKTKMPKFVKRRLSSWIKGIIQKRLEYKCSAESIEIVEVNPAYTSQVCHKCGKFGKRNGKYFTCPDCGTMDADKNASHNIESRINDKEVRLDTPYKKVKEILLMRAVITVSATV